MIRLTLVWLFAAVGCGQARELDGQLAILRRVSNEARAHAAYRCAPEELANAEVHLEFAEHELDAGDLVRARQHLTLARANALAAARLSGHPSCAESTRPNSTPGAHSSPARTSEYSAQPPLRRGSSRNNAAI